MPIRMPSWFRRAPKQSIPIGGNAGPGGMLQGIYTSTQGAPPLLNTKALLEGFDSMPWLRAVTDKVGTAISLTEWRLYAVGKAPADERASLHVNPNARFEYRMSDLVAMAGDAVAREVARRVRAVTGQLEPWAKRDVMLQRSTPRSRWKSMAALRKRGMLTEIAEHPFYDALNNPNPFMGQSGLMKLTEVSLDLVGDAFWMKERNGSGQPSGFWPVPAHWIIETPTPIRPTFRVGWQGWQKMIPESEILWFHEPSPVHPYERGSGIGFAIGDELEIDEYLAKMTKQMFFNDADPKWIFAGGDAVSETEMRRLERDMVQRNQGFWRKFKPFFMVGGGDDINKRIHEFQRPTMEQLVYPGLRDKQRDIVLQTYGAPPELFGILENSNRATVEASEYLFAKWVLLPRAERLRITIQTKLLQEYDDRLVLDYESPVEADKVHALNVMSKAPWAWTADEWRATAGSGPLPESDEQPGAIHMVPMNSYLTDDLADETKRPKAPTPVIAPPSAPGEPPAPEGDGEGEEKPEGEKPEGEAADGDEEPPKEPKEDPKPEPKPKKKAMRFKKEWLR